MSSIVAVRQTEFSNFEALHDAVQDAPSEIVQLEPGQMTGKLVHMSIGSAAASAGRFTHGLRARGILSEHRLNLGTILGGPPALFQDIEAAPGDLIFIKPNHEVYARYFGATAYVGTFVEPEELFAFLATEPKAQDAAVWRQSATLLAADPATAVARTEQLKVLLMAIRDHGPTMSAEVADYYKRCLLELMIAPVLNGNADYRPQRLRSALPLVREVDRFLIEAGSRSVHISELVDHFGVPRRSLHRAFAEVLGMSPMQFFRRKRLGDAHNALLMAAPGGVTIEGIAIRHGFLHVGRFAREYQLLFGELPSDTLRHSAESLIAPLSAPRVQRSRQHHDAA